MTSDWKEKLASLATEMPQADTAGREKPVSSAPSADVTGNSSRGKANIIYERKGRGGKEVTIIADTRLSEDQLQALASELKKKLGAGGSCRGGEILIQGDRRKHLSELLRSMGFKTNI